MHELRRRPRFWHTPNMLPTCILSKKMLVLDIAFQQLEHFCNRRWRKSSKQTLMQRTRRLSFQSSWCGCPVWMRSMASHDQDVNRFWTHWLLKMQMENNHWDKALRQDPRRILTSLWQPQRTTAKIQCFAQKKCIKVRSEGPASILCLLQLQDAATEEGAAEPEALRYGISNTIDTLCSCSFNRLKVLRHFACWRVTESILVDCK